MLRRITIQNVALIEQAELEFSEGLNVLSGETGAGKSVILDSIDFVLGAKADKSLIRFGKSECSVRAEFEAVSPAVLEALEEIGVESDDTLIISRKYTCEGKNSLKLNGCTVTAAMLKRVSAHLVDVHGQSDHFYLLNESNQLKLLDSIAGEPLAKEKDALAGLLDRRKRAKEEINLIGGDETERSRRADILKYQIDEIERAKLKEGEEEQLIELRNRAMNAERIAEGLSSARAFLASDGGSVDGIHAARRALMGLARYGDKYAELSQRLESTLAELTDVASIAEEYGDELEIDSRELERVEARLDEYKSLKKKYGATLDEIQTFYEKASAEYTMLSGSEERLARLSEEITKVNGEIYESCKRLSALRKSAAEGFTRRVSDELKTLNIASARFETQFDAFSKEDAEKAGTSGLDRMRFLFSANAGEPPKELGKIISGGEMSRFMLAIKAQLSSLGSIGTYLFDEIDAGIGGKTARVMGEKFLKIAKNVQIIAVTHSAQIAALADKQFLIEKREENNSTGTYLKEVSKQERVKEIARLIGGSESELSIRHAEEMLQSASVYKNSL